MKNENKASVNVNVDIDLDKDIIILYPFDSGRDIHEKISGIPACTYIELYHIMRKKINGEGSLPSYAFAV